MESYEFFFNLDHYNMIEPADELTDWINDLVIVEKLNGKL